MFASFCALVLFLSVCFCVSGLYFHFNVIIFIEAFQLYGNQFSSSVFSFSFYELPLEYDLYRNILAALIFSMFFVVGILISNDL